jgi:hypothetical protein
MNEYDDLNPLCMLLFSLYAVQLEGRQTRLLFVFVLNFSINVRLDLAMVC